MLDALRESWSLFKREPTLLIVAALLAAHRRLHGQSARIRDGVDGRASAVSALVAWLLIGVAAALGFALAVIPGLLLIAATCFAFHEIGYRKHTAIEAIKGSFALFKA